jgi:hypothetical protein
MFRCTVKRNIVNTNVYKTDRSVATTLLSSGNNKTSKCRFPPLFGPGKADNAHKRLAQSSVRELRSWLLYRPNIGHTTVAC